MAYKDMTKERIYKEWDISFRHKPMRDGSTSTERTRAHSASTKHSTPAAEPRKGFVFFLSWAECLADLRPTERATVYDALVSYAQTGEAPELKGKCKMALAFILKDFERADAKYQQTIERRRAAGRMGGGQIGNLSFPRKS